MTDVHQQIELLKALQEKDRVLDQLKSKIEGNPELIAAQKELLGVFKADGEDKKKHLLDIQKARKEKEMDLDTRENEIKKHSMELNAVKSNDAYKALLHEIDAAKQAKSVLEDEILQLMVEVENELVNSKKVEAEFKIKEQKVQAEIAKLEAEAAKSQIEFDQKKAERDEFAKQIPQDLLSRYDYIRESRDGVAVAALDGDNCGGCSSVLRPQTINDVIKGKEIVTCDNCQRIIYKKNEA